MAEAEATVTRGLGSGLGAILHVPVRLVRDRVRYEDLARGPFTPPVPGLHHRNETRSGIGDPQISLMAGSEGSDWTVAGKVGVSIPLGRTEPNPFALGREGRAHEHTQFGTGTWDPLLEAGLGRPVGPVQTRLTAFTRLPIARNEHGYRAGRRYALLLDVAHRPSRNWSLESGLALAREEAETWDGEVEHEGNLGRTDLFLTLGVTRAATAIGRMQATVQIPIASHVREHQTDIPLIVRLAWSP